MKNILYELIHTIISVICVGIFTLFGMPILGAAIATSFYIGREHAQAEYRWIERYGNHKRANMKWYNAFEPRIWSFHSWFWNLTLPATVSVLLALYLAFD